MPRIQRTSPRAIDKLMADAKRRGISTKGGFDRLKAHVDARGEELSSLARQFRDFQGSAEEKWDWFATQMLRMEEKWDSCATKADLASFRQEVLSRFDGFAKNQERLDHELIAIIGRQDRLEGVHS